MEINIICRCYFRFLTQKRVGGGGHVPVFLIRNALRHIAPFIIFHLAKACFHLFMTLVQGEKSSMIQGTSGKLKDYASSGMHKGEKKNYTGFWAHLHLHWMKTSIFKVLTTNLKVYLPFYSRAQYSWSNSMTSSCILNMR